MANATDYRIEGVQKATVNGVACILFKAFKRRDDAFVFIGKFTAPTRTAKRDLWKIADQAE